jgi:hypothetical protein
MARNNNYRRQAYNNYTDYGDEFQNRNVNRNQNENDRWQGSRQVQSWDQDERTGMGSRRWGRNSNTGYNNDVEDNDYEDIEPRYTLSDDVDYDEDESDYGRLGNRGAYAQRRREQDYDNEDDNRYVDEISNQSSGRSRNYDIEGLSGGSDRSHRWENNTGTTRYGRGSQGRRNPYR